MRIKEWGLTALGVLSLFWPWATVQPFVNDDYDAELKTNPQLAAKPMEVEKRKLEYVADVRQRLRIFRRGVWGSFFFLVTAIIAATLLAAFYFNPSPKEKVWLGGASIFVFAWSTLARLSRKATSMGGNTLLERVDLHVFWIFYWVGTLLGTLALI